MGIKKKSALFEALFSLYSCFEQKILNNENDYLLFEKEGVYMKIKIPDLYGEENYIEDKSSIVLIGANGAGKTRMSVWIDENNPEINIHRISAQKSLNLPKMTSPIEMQTAAEEFLYGTTSENKDWLIRFGKKDWRWGESPETHLLDDFHKLMQYLVTENYEKSIEYREKNKEGEAEFDNFTRLEKIKEIWEDVIKHRRLKICAGKIEASNRIEGNYYNGSEMSDGERAIFYFIGEVLCAQENSLIIVDEPENHLHKSILVRLWDAIEISREDCIFLYITHNLDFASSRMNSQ
ncbi:MAG: ATP-binding protein, partial [Erysipelotrichaceae bacterium]|nr:ATP-binding protein [Erysipelotrichaceae bacterium]